MEMLTLQHVTMAEIPQINYSPPPFSLLRKSSGKLQKYFCFRGSKFVYATILRKKIVIQEAECNLILQKCE